MLNDALSYKQVFDHLRRIEKQFICAPSDEDWKLAKEVYSRLKLFCDIAEMVSGAKYATANMCFPKVCGISMACMRGNGLYARMK